MSMLRNNIVRLARTNRPQITADAEEKPKTLRGLDCLDKLGVADEHLKALPFEMRCGIKNGIAIFFAQLKGGKSIGVTPVMPKDEYGNPLTPDNVANGASGYLVLKVSENAKIAEDDNGRMDFTVRPTFVAFEPNKADADKRVAAAK